MQAAAAPEDPVLPIYVDPVNGSDATGDGKSWDTAVQSITNAIAKSDTAAYYNERRVQVTLAKGTYLVDTPIYLRWCTSLVGDPECDRSEIVLTSDVVAKGRLNFGSTLDNPKYINTIANLTISNFVMNGGSSINCAKVKHNGLWTQVISNVVFTQCRRVSGPGTDGSSQDSNPSAAGITAGGRTLVVDCLFSGLTNSFQNASVGICNNGGWFRNCRIENCYTAGGGQIFAYVNAGWNVSLTEYSGVENCTFSNNVSAAAGGCVRDISIVRDSTFVDNVSGTQGAAGYWSNDSYFTTSFPQVVNCTFVGNAANGQHTPGGVLSFWCGGVVTNSTFTGNSSKGWCAGVAHALDIVDCTFTSNVCTFLKGNAAAVGGVFFYDEVLGKTLNATVSYPEGRTPLVSGCRFVGNSSGIGSRGGAMRTRDVSVEVEDCVFEGNDAGFGGAIAWDAPGGSIRDCTFSGNVAYEASGGAALYVQITNETSSAALTVRNCLFEGNALTNASVQCKGSAAVLLSSGPRILLESCTVVANSAAYGEKTAAIYCADANGAGIGQAYLTNTVVALNVGAGGATASAVSSASGFTQELAARIGYSYLHPAAATSAEWWTEAQHVTDSDVAPKFKSGTWIPSTSSALRDAGLAMDWMTGAFDLQRDADGNAFVQHVYGAAPDVGAFERVPAGGFTVIVR